MKTRDLALRFLPGFVVLLASCTPVGAPEPALPPEPRVPEPNPEMPDLPRDYGEVRALWVVRTTLGDPDSIVRMVERAEEGGFNTLIVQVRGRGDAYYRSEIEPVPELMALRGASFDPLALVISEAHARGLSVHAWVNTHLVGGIGPLPVDPLHLVNRSPHLLAVPRDLARELYDVDPGDPSYVAALHRYAKENTERLEGIYSSPSHEDTYQHIENVFTDIVSSYAVDGLHLDYVRYPSPDFDFSRPALEEFRQWLESRLGRGERNRLSNVARGDVLAYVDAYPSEWSEFRRLEMNRLVEGVRRAVKAARPDLTLSAAVFANSEDAYLNRYQDWRRWLRTGVLDVAVPMAYTPDNRFFRTQIESAVDEVGGGRIWAGIGTYQTTLRGTVEKIEIARELGAAGFSLFSYDWAVSEGESDRRDVPFLRRVGEEAFQGGRR